MTLDLAMIGFCGVDCSACADLASGVCPGCKQSTWDEGDACPPVSCCAEHGVIACGLCAEFPCQMMVEFYGESESHARAYELMRGMTE